MNVKLRQSIEKKITRRIISDAIAAGYLILVDEIMDEEGPSKDLKHLMEQVSQMDEDRLMFYKPDDLKKCVGWVFLVYGNDGWDAISDYTTNLEDVLVGANKVADQQEKLFG